MDLLSYLRQQDSDKGVWRYCPREISALLPEVQARDKVIEMNVDGKFVPVGEDVLKTKSSFRTLPLIPAVENLLLAERERQAKNRRLFKGSYCRDYLDYICVDESGKLLRPNYVTEHFAWILRKYWLRKIRFHDIRHPNVKPKTQTFWNLESLVSHVILQESFLNYYFSTENPNSLNFSFCFSVSPCSLERSNNIVKFFLAREHPT